MQSQALKICVVGGGIMGLSSAYALSLEYPGSAITIYAEDFPPNTTSNHGFGIVLCRHYDKKMNNVKVAEWSKLTSQYCSRVAQQPGLAKLMGINPIHGHFVFSKEREKRIKKDPNQESIFSSASLQETCTYYRECTSSEIEETFTKKDVELDVTMSIPKQNYRLDDMLFYSYGTFIMDTDVYLLWLMRTLSEMASKQKLQSVKFIHETIHHLCDLTGRGYDLIVNCSGLGAGKIADDEQAIPIRAQWTLIRAPDITKLYYAGTTCICPRPGRVALGSVFQLHRTDMEIDPSVTKDNWSRAKGLFPNIQEGQILGEYVRLRPGRIGGARLEYERFKGGSSPLHVIHNYGHAGTGIGQHWGCALDVVKISKSIPSVMRKSKL